MRPAAFSGSPVPVVEQVPARVGHPERQDLRRLAGRILCEEPRLGDVDSFGLRVRSGLLEAPALLLPDHSGIALREVAGVPNLEYRLLALGSQGSLLPLTAPRCPPFEALFRGLPGFGTVEVVCPAPGPEPLWRLFLNDPQCMDRAVAAASRHRRLNLLPYMGIGGAWRLAGAVAAASGARVAVAAPPPRLTLRVNDKLWFARRVRELLGSRAVPEALSAHGPAVLAAQVSAFARRFDRICLKLPSCAGAEGNATLEAEPLRRMSLWELRDLLLGLMDSRGWARRFPLLVGVWEAPVLSSPSVQLWIPHREEDPVVEGVFRQVLDGATGAFVGVMPSDLPEEWLLRLGREAVLLGGLFQELGYFGRCSFDALLVGGSLATAELSWIECNGRWGGTSLPMTLVNRLSGSWRRTPFVAVEHGKMSMAPRDFGAVLEELSDLLYEPGRPEGILFLSPSRLEQGRGFDFVALAGSTSRAAALATAATERLTAVARERAAPAQEAAQGIP